ncbi:MAG: DUF2239 family protein [Neisseriaceae bacterium]|nr:DUF2239 family protein [Neisseriaceae bacterium]
MPTTPSYTCFHAHHLLASGDQYTVALAAKRALDQGQQAILIFDDRSGRSIDFNLQGSVDEVLARYPKTAVAPAPAVAPPRGRGRPKLGVVPREITLLPRHWDWLATQPGGASVTLRKLVEQARRSQAGPDGIREAQERAYHFMSAMAGDLPQFEAASRALFAQDQALLTTLTQPWPKDIQAHIVRLNTPDDATD